MAATHVTTTAAMTATTTVAIAVNERLTDERRSEKNNDTNTNGAKHEGSSSRKQTQTSTEKGDIKTSSGNRNLWPSFGYIAFRLLSHFRHTSGCGVLDGESFREQFDRIFKSFPKESCWLQSRRIPDSAEFA